MLREKGDKLNEIELSYYIINQFRSVHYVHLRRSYTAGDWLPFGNSEVADARNITGGNLRKLLDDLETLGSNKSLQGKQTVKTSLKHIYEII